MKKSILILYMFISLLSANEIIQRNKMIKYNPTLTLEAAQMYLNEAEKIATSKNLNLSIAVVDSSGYLLAFYRMDNASLVTIDVAIEKAKTAAFLNAPSKVFEEMINQGTVSLLTTPNVTPLQGGVPIIYNDEVCGAIGVSGASGDVDNSVANDTVKAINISKEK